MNIASGANKTKVMKHLLDSKILFNSKIFHSSCLDSLQVNYFDKVYRYAKLFFFVSQFKDKCVRKYGDNNQPIGIILCIRFVFLKTGNLFKQLNVFGEISLLLNPKYVNFVTRRKPTIAFVKSIFKEACRSLFDFWALFWWIPIYGNRSHLYALLYADLVNKILT